MAETHPLFPSGPWEGFYTYHMGPDAHRHHMHFTLSFDAGIVTGGGGDDVGGFSWRGHYDKAALTCDMVKHYATHTVLYQGQVDENGIWGVWRIGDNFSGGFHIWPKAGEEEAVEEAVTEQVGTRNN